MGLVATVLLLDGVNFELRDAMRSAIDQKKLRLDARLIKELYAACPPRLKPRFAFAAVSRLAPRDFKPIFMDAYRREMTVEQRFDLAGRLDYFLRQNPEEAPKYRPLIRELLKSPEPDLCTAGLVTTGLLDDLEPAELRFIERKLSARFADHRMNAVNALARLVGRRDQIAPEVRAFCESKPVLTRIRWMRTHDRNELVRECARVFFRVAAARQPKRSAPNPRSK
jgi:hypothetical protein